MSDNVYKMFKICSGEFVLSRVAEETDTDITLDGAFEVIFRPAPNGQLGINLFPLNPLAGKLHEQYKINKSNIIFFCDFIDQGILDQYIEITTGIKLVKKDNLIVLPNGQKA